MLEKRGAEASWSDRQEAKHKSRSSMDTYKTRLLHFKQVGLFLSDSHRSQVRQGLIMRAFLSLNCVADPVSFGIGQPIFANVSNRYALYFYEPRMRK